MTALQQVLYRSNDDLEFREALLAGDVQVLGRYELSQEERAGPA